MSNQWPTYPQSSDPAGLVPYSESPLPAVPVQPVELDPLERLATRGQTFANPVVFAAGSDTLRKTGQWVVPAYLLIKGGMGKVFLDMQRATASTAVISVAIQGGLGEIVIVVPSGWAADVSEVGSGLGSRTSKVVDHPAPGCPILYVTGALALGSLTIRYPKPRDERRRDREIRREQAQQSQYLR